MKVAACRTIKDSGELLAHVGAVNNNALPSNVKVLKHAGLVMAFSVWKTYVINWFLKEMNRKLGVMAGS